MTECKGALNNVAMFRAGRRGRKGDHVINRFRGVWRDAWWLLLILLGAGLLVALLFSWGFGITIWLVTLFCFGYFAIMRYDDSGRERPNA